MSKMKRAIEKFQIDIKMKRLDLHFKRELENVREKSPVEVKSLELMIFIMDLDFMVLTRDGMSIFMQ